MTLLLLDGCEDATSWTGTPFNVTGAAARNGTTGWSSLSTTAANFTVPAALESATMTVGFAMRMNTNATLTTFFGLRSDAGATLHVGLGLTSGGDMTICRGTTTLQTVTGVWTPTGQWKYVELQAALHDTTGSYTLRVDGTVVASATNTDTKNAGTKTTFDTVRWASSGSVSHYIDDIYIQAGTTDSFLGDIIVETLYPNGNGDTSQWLGSDGNSTDNYLLVDEAGTPVTTDYVTTATAAQQDLYTMGNLSVSNATIVGICHVAHAAGSDMGARQIKLLNRRATTTASPAQPFPATMFGNAHYALTTDPETGSAFTVANVNALQSGVELA